jgi:hypothetical protein
MIGSIELNDAEKTLLAQIKLDAAELEGYEDTRRNGQAVHALMKSLIDRKAIPEVRWRYFSDPKFRVGGRGTSHKGAFERNGRRGAEIVEHPHFLEYLRYFLHGVDLPASVVGSFSEKVSSCGMVTSGDVVPLGKHARQLTRLHCHNGREVSEEVYKLALDCGLSQSYAEAIRNSVR